MGFISDWHNREPKKEIAKGTPEKQGLALFFDVLWREFWELCKLNLIFILFSLPVVTIPVAITAMSKVIFYMLLDKPVYAFGDFYSSFRLEWKRATLAGLIYSMVLALTVVGMVFYTAFLDVFVLYVMSMLACALILIAGFYLFPMLAVLDLNLKGIFKNAILLTFLRMPQNICALVLFVLLTLLVLVYLPTTLLAVLVIFFSLINLISTFCAYTALKKFVLTDGSDS